MVCIHIKRILIKIRKKYPYIEINIRADSGFSDPAFYKLADLFNLEHTIGQASNEVLKGRLSVLHRKFLASMFQRVLSIRSL